MYSKILVALVLISSAIPAAIAQRRPAAAGSAPSLDLSVGYNYIGANSPPGGKDDFGLQGGYVSGGIGLRDWLSVEGEFTGGRASKISTLGQDLTLMTFAVGPQISFQRYRFVPFGKAMFGGAHASDSFFPGTTSSTTSATSWAVTGGGGLDYNLNSRFAIRAIDVEYLRTAFPNGSTNNQNQLMIGAGIVIRFGGGRPVLISSAPTPSQISFTCSTSVASIEQGKVLEINGNSLTHPSRAGVNYTWSSNGGSIQGAGRRVTLSTSGLPAGDYLITGHAALASDASIDASCEATFRVFAREEPVQAATSDDHSKDDQIFHRNVADALFDYDSYAVRPDAQAAIDRAAQYLKENPAVGVLIAGYADERGSAEYNLALAEKRANAARNALMADGLAPDRLEIISYGKEAQLCTQQTETCFQQNRRAAFNMRH